MLSGQETITDIIKRYPQTKAVLRNFGFTLAAERHFRYRNLAHAAVITKLSLRKILEDLTQITGEKFVEPKVSGIPVAPNSGLRKGIPSGIKKIIAVHSGKGGVGKTFISLNLAAFLAKKTYKVGLLDADVDCPNVMKILQLNGKLIADKNKKIVPLEKFNIKVISMIPLLDQEDQVLMWRGPIVSRVVEQFLFDVVWGSLDFLIVDLPPGTSDIPLTLFQMVKEAKLLLVSTPQELALLDAKKSINMAKNMHIDIAGIVENMAGPIFGKGTTKKVASMAQIPFLGSIPLEKLYATPFNDGMPHVLAFPKLQANFERITKNTNLFN